MPSSPPAFTVVTGLQPLPEPLARPVLAIGNFDGVHRGHQAVIGAALALGRTLGRPTLALTFEPHPRQVFQPDVPLFRLTPEPQKLKALGASGLAGAIVLPFDKALAGLSAEAFVADVLVGRFGVAGAAVGFDFHFGKARAGSPAFLKAEGARHGFPVEVVEAMLDEGDSISSTAIRQALESGQVGHAAHMLGRPWSLKATVIHGDKRGRELGYPTANLALPPEIRLAFGIYAVKVTVGGRTYDAVASYGRRPTFDNGRALLEVHLFDFSGNLYGLEVEVAFHGYLRPELKFDGIDELVRQMDADSRAARAILAAAPTS
ncbi:bifunctional riboflavin kinase/FAD synthetase [Azorhizobium doebereinerae]|uniref:bifunctional riboflavin kinase/FAD synthetase n=1 Tax=Azorhizobium doebereinerae TaxID=281091 RepID=UPI00048E4BA2|nr:bifunctional riboflavin kinase/FAD synthetase [Azorhizobium doebereinerae]